jgi:hypothetical protein
MVAALESTSTIKTEDIARGVNFSADARAMIGESRNPRDFLGRLLAKGLAYDAARVVVRALPKPYCVAWACECIRMEAAKKPLSSEDMGCLESAEAWLHTDGDESRRLAAERAEAANFATPSAWVAAAAGWSGGSLAPRGYAVVAPAPQLTADACFAAVCVLAVAEPAAAVARLGGWVERACATFGRVPSAS